MSNYYETLTRPRIFDEIPVTGNILRNTLEEQGQDLLEDTQLSTQKLTIAIRTLNEADGLRMLLDSIQDQRTLGDTQIVVVDNESTDRTPNVAKAFGAELITLPRSAFTYARSMNLCMEAADHPNVFMTVGHAVLASTVAVEAGKRQMEDAKVAGAFAVILPNRNASRTERLVAVGNVGVNKPKEIKKASMGVMGASAAVFRKQAWQELGRFDERIQNGGEDTQLAKEMLDAGYKIMREPLLAVHHSHALGPINYAKQVLAWTKMARGEQSEFDLDAIKRRRPDLDFS